MKTCVSIWLGLSLGIGGVSVALATAVVLPPAAIAQTNESAMPIESPQLANTEWLLEDLGGAGVIDNIQTTLRFDGVDHITGRGGCNQYRATAQLQGDRLTVNGIASTRKLCPPAVMNQEMRYFQALEKADRIRVEGPYLLIDSSATQAPLRFTRLSSTTATTGTIVAFESRRNAVRVFMDKGSPRLNVYDKRDRVTWLRAAPLIVSQAANGTRYTTSHGESTVVVFVPKSGGSPVLSINGKADR